MISKKDLEIIESIGYKTLPSSEFLKLNLERLDFKNCIEILDYYLDINDVRSFNIVFWFFPKDISQFENEKLYRKYILNSSHYEHEEMVNGFFNEYRGVENIKVLVELITHPPKYFYDEGREYVFIRKCIDVLKVQRYPDSYNAIKEISENTKDETIEKMTAYLVDNWSSKNEYI